MTPQETLSTKTCRRGHLYDASLRKCSICKRISEKKCMIKQATNKFIKERPLDTICSCGRVGCDIPYGYCHCGCGQKTDISAYDEPKRGYIAGVPRKFCYRHKKIAPLIEEAMPFKIEGVYCRLIPLSRGMYTIVWESDYKWLMQWKWSAYKSGKTNKYYAFRTGPTVNGRTGEGIWMAREIMGLKYGDMRDVDHIEPNATLDNRRSNLRIANDSQNRCNTRKRSDNTSGYKGVSYDKRRSKWIASISVNGISKYLGRFDTAEEASFAYCDAAPKYHGEFARIDD